MNMRKITFDPEAFEQLGTWGIEDKKIFKKILSLIRDAQRNPFSGLGKPEPFYLAGIIMINHQQK